MKVSRFGTISGNDDGSLSISEFIFVAEKPEEVGNANCEEYAMPAIIRHLSNKCQVPVVDAAFDKYSEIVVLRAIQKAKGQQFSVGKKGISTNWLMKLVNFFRKNTGERYGDHA